MRTHQDIPEEMLRDVGLEPRYAVTPLRHFPTNEAAPEFPIDALPKTVGRLVREAAKAIGCPPDAIGLSALVALGSAIGNARVIQPKKKWSESAAIYGAVIAESGEKKTAAVSAACDVVQKLDYSYQREYEKKLDEHAREKREYEVEKRDAQKAGLAAPPPPRAPEARRVWVNDTTVEALVPILKENPRGLLSERDELVGWVKSMDQYKSGGRGSERQFWLSTWSGKQVSVDRKSQEAPTTVCKPLISIIGGIQPDVLEDLAENREDGMLERFLFVYPETLNSMWTDEDISDGALVAYSELHERLRLLYMETDDEGDPIEKPVAFAPGAMGTYIDAYNIHRREMTAPGFPRYLRSVWAKLEAYTLRLTLIMACCRFTEEGVAERVEEEDVLRAVHLVGYFKDTARRVFGELRGYDPKMRLLEAVASFVAGCGGEWVGTPTELHNKLPYVHKPNRPDELSKFIKEAAEGEERFTYEHKAQRFKDEQSGKWETQKILTLKVF